MTFDGGKAPIDTVQIATYHALLEGNGTVRKDSLQSKVTRWFDLNGYHSMSIKLNYSPIGVTKITEQITRDKHSLITARNISVEAPNTEPAVTLARLKRRHKGTEEWLYRHYFTPKKYLEDASLLTYKGDSLIMKKQQAESGELITNLIEVFDQNNKLISRTSMRGGEEPHIQLFYNHENGLLDSINATFFDKNNPAKITNSYIEKYTYEFNSVGDKIKMYTYRKDSLTFITEYVYGYRK